MALVILLCLLIAALVYVWKYRKETALWKKILVTFSALFIFIITAGSLSPATEATQKLSDAVTENEELSAVISELLSIKVQ
ncbi:hypothetical protein ACDX78_19305 [Virgibacillus oceani]